MPTTLPMNGRVARVRLRGIPLICRDACGHATTARSARYRRSVSQDNVRGRVEAFVADFHRGWERAGKPPSSLIFDQAPVEAWAGELAVLVGAHFTTGASTGEEGVLSGRAAHDPSLETITEVKVGADRATVCSVIDNGSVPTYYEYHSSGWSRECQQQAWSGSCRSSSRSPTGPSRSGIGPAA
jgi:hypothetical protein